MSVDHASGVTAPKADPVFLHVGAGMTVIVEDGSDWRMADVIWVDGAPKAIHAVSGGRRGHGHHQLGQCRPRDPHRSNDLNHWHPWRMDTERATTLMTRAAWSAVIASSFC